MHWFVLGVYIGLRRVIDTLIVGAMIALYNDMPLLYSTGISCAPRRVERILSESYAFRDGDRLGVSAPDVPHSTRGDRSCRVGRVLDSVAALPRRAILRSFVK